MGMPAAVKNAWARAQNAAAVSLRERGPGPQPPQGEPVTSYRLASASVTMPIRTPPSTVTGGRVRIGIVLGLAAGLLLAGCDTAPPEAAPAPTTTAVTLATPAPTPPTTTVTGPTPAPTPPTTPTRAPPVTVDGPCPYADAATVMDIVGQHIARTTVTKTTPHLGCAFYRPNAEKAAELSVSVLASATAAQTEAIRLTGPGANPVDSVADGGAVAITGDGAVLAVSKGSALVVVRINQRVSLEAIELAKLVVAKV